jgi:hypothetical protein
MAEKAIYEHGELDTVRSRLGVKDEEEAKRMAKLLGGEVGVEKAKQPEPEKKTISRIAPKHRIELASDEEDPLSTKKKTVIKITDPADDPAVPLRQNYFERVRMDKFAAHPEFDIKHMGQVMISVFSLIVPPTDYVSALFINKRMDEYYKKIEVLVVSTRTMFPRNNLKRNEQIKKASPFTYNILDTIRYWNIERITSDLARLRAHPRHVKVGDLADILRVIYKPLFILEKLKVEVHIKGALKLLYKYLYIENPMGATKYQELIRVALGAYISICKDVHYLLYPLLLKLVSNRWLPYEAFFSVRKNRIMAFLGVTEAEQIPPADILVKLKETPTEDPVAENNSLEEQPSEKNFVW